MTAPDIKLMHDGRWERRVTGTEFFTPYHPVTMEPWTQETALAFTVEMEEQFKSDYAQQIQDQLAQPPAPSTSPYRQELTDLTMTPAPGEHLLTVEHELSDNSTFHGFAMGITTPIVTNGPNTFDVFIQISGVDTLLGTNATDRLSKTIDLPLGSNPKLIFVPSGVGATEFLSGAVTIRTHWFKPFLVGI